MLRATLCAALAASLLSTSVAAQSATREKVLAALPGLKALAEQTVAKGEVPGLSIAVVHRDEVVYLAGFGLRQSGGSDKVDADTVFQLASLSKPIAATVVAGLVGDGPVSWDSASAISIPALRCTIPIPRRRSRSATCSPIAADCRARSATTSRSWATPRGKSFAVCVWQSRATASAAATPTAILASPRARSPRRAFRARAGRRPPRKGSTSRSA